MYGHVKDGIVDSVGRPPDLAWDGTRWWDLRTRNLDVLALMDWYVLLEATRPEDTPTTTHDAGYTFDGDRVFQVWTPRPKTPAELLVDTSEANQAAIENDLANAIVTLRAIRDDTNANINQNPAARIKDIAKALLQTDRHVLRRFDGTS